MSKSSPGACTFAASITSCLATLCAQQLYKHISTNIAWLAVLDVFFLITLVVLIFLLIVEAES